MSEIYKNPVKKVIPSKLETGFQQFMYRHVGGYIPKSITPNQMTLIGVIGGLFAILSTVLTCISPYFFIGTLLGLTLHMSADVLDGYLARSRNMSSRAGAYFDLITDVFFSTFLMLALGFSPYGSLEIMIFAVPVYGIINVTAMNYIIYFNEFLFPRLGPVEAHITYAAVAILSMVFKSKTIISVFDINLKIADIILFIGLIPTYYEMLRLAVGLFKRLRKLEESA